jgi:hypothetical protein
VVAPSPLPFLAACALIQPHPPPRLHRGRLDRRVGDLQPEPQGVVVRVFEVGVGLSLEGGDLVRDVGQVAGYVLDGVGVVSAARIHLLMIRKGGGFYKLFYGALPRSNPLPEPFEALRRRLRASRTGAMPILNANFREHVF